MRGAQEVSVPGRQCAPAWQGMTERARAGPGALWGQVWEMDHGAARLGTERRVAHLKSNRNLWPRKGEKKVEDDRS